MRRRGLLVDLVATQSGTSAHRGVARWVSGLAAALVAGHGDRVRRLLLDPGLPVPGDLHPTISASSRLAANTAAEVRRAAVEGPAAYVLGSPFEFAVPIASLLPAHVMGAPDLPLAAILYDVIPLMRAPTYLADAGFERQYRQRLQLLRRCDLVLAISECTRRDGVAAAGLDPARVVTVGSGVDPFFHPTAGEDPRVAVRAALPAVDRPFVLTVSAADERKNTETLIAAFAALDPAARRAHRLVVTCLLVDGLEQRLRRAAAAAGLGEEEMVLTGQVDDHLLRNLYRACVVFAFPSRYEGFGLPVAEAMACGAPVVTADTSSLPEVLDLREATFAPEDAPALTRLLGRVLTDPGFAARLRAEGLARAARHSWPAVAARTLAAVDAVLGEGPVTTTSVTVRRPLRVALAGPMPPVASGVAVYNQRVAAELGSRCRLDILDTKAAGESRVAPPPGGGRFPLAALGRALNPAAYDAIVYTLGNNHDHLATVTAMRAWPGLAWLHDVRLPFLLDSLREQPEPPGEPPWAWADAVLAEREPRPPRRRPPPGPWRGPAGAVDLAVELAAASRAVLVNGPHAAGLLRQEAERAGVTLPPVHSLGGHAVPRLAADPATGRDRPPLVVSMGIVDPVKRPDLIIDAHAAVHARTGARLALVGLVGDRHAAELRARAERLGIGSVVTLTGRVDAADYCRWLHRASVAVQLRARSNGESSGAIADCLGAGLPVITDHPGAREELGEATAVHLAPGAGVRALAEAEHRLLTDPGAWAAQSRAALGYALVHPFSRVAEELLAVIAALAPRPLTRAAP